MLISTGNVYQDYLLNISITVATLTSPSTSLKLSMSSPTSLYPMGAWTVYGAFSETDTTIYPIPQPGIWWPASPILSKDNWW